MPRKPYLIDPSEEGRRPPGVDGTWWAQCLGWPQMLFPRRFRGGPPLFYLASLMGLLWGFLFCVGLLLGVPIGQMAHYPENPAVPPPVMNALVGVMTAAGLVQGLGVLLRKRWGLIAAYVWYALWLVPGWPRNVGPGEMIGLLIGVGFCTCFVIYYHNRRAWFGFTRTAPAAPPGR